MRVALPVSLAAVGVLSLVTAAPASAAAVVERGQSCAVDRGDIPALPDGVVTVDAHETIVTTPQGGLTYTCTGRLPAGVTVDRTVQGLLPCFASDTVVVAGHYVVTRSGRLHYTCHFPAGSV